ncbi:MAG: hypothetical protein Q6373_009755, partial [Candidatus Sigynarchaeota archaeon]
MIELKRLRRLVKDIRWAHYQFTTNPIPSPTNTPFLNGTWDGWDVSEGRNTSDLYQKSNVNTASVSWRALQKDVELKVFTLGANCGTRWASFSTEFVIPNKPGYVIESVRLSF